MKREISRINNQVRRGMHRIEEALSEVEKNQTLLRTNADQVVKEIDEINRRLTLALKERTDYLKSSVEKYVSNEMKSLKDLKDNLDLEITNITSNADLMEKNLDDGTKWDDTELMDEATSAMDTHTQKRAAEGIAAEQSRLGFSIVQVAHRIETLTRSDVLYFVEQGKVVEVGGERSLSGRAIDELVARDIA